MHQNLHVKKIQTILICLKNIFLPLLIFVSGNLSRTRLSFQRKRPKRRSQDVWLLYYDYKTFAPIMVTMNICQPYL